MSVSGNSSSSSGITLFTSKTPMILGQKLYVVITVTVAGIITILILLFVFLYYKHTSKRKNNRTRVENHVLPVKLQTKLQPKSNTKAINNVEVMKSISSSADRNNNNNNNKEKVVAKSLISMFEIDDIDEEIKPMMMMKEVKLGNGDSCGSNYESGLVTVTVTATGTGTGTTGSDGGASSSMCSSSESMSSMCWGRWFGLGEIEIATNRFAEENVIGEGGYGIVYRGNLLDGSAVAVKDLLNNRGQAEKEFKVEVEAIGKVRHKNLVGLIGFCTEGAKRLLVYEYVDNGNLEQWLHGEVGSTSPLTWDIRMKIAVGTAKGLAYLHEGLEPKVVHRDVKSSNILLDKKWNARVADFGLAKLLESEQSYVTTRVMGTFGYVSPDYASTGMLNEASDVYSFGVCLMELVTGRSPVDYSRPPGEMNLVDWFKATVASRRGEDLLDPKIAIRPSPRALKRALLVCLRCIDMDASKRPKMGQIVHMLETEEFSFRRDPRTPRDTTTIIPDAPSATKVRSPMGEDEQR